ncbi:N-acetylmuramoyl-L-alanine amidase [Actinoplanes sp. NPDC023714]|uniref:peptidoglycan recognition protein family protein n=1 Tax=Actinoplanes sp. NPDC023714 TaxID=3154322 RepID=UPI00340FA474
MRRLLAALAAVTPAAAVAVAITDPGSVRTSGPVLQTFAFAPAPAAPRDGMRLAAEETRQGETRHGYAELPRRRTGPFSMVGVTWRDPEAPSAGRIEVRTRAAATGRWTPWQLLETDNPDASGGAEGARGASDPLWVGPSDGVQARMAGTALPEGLRVDLINPDGSDDLVDPDGSGDRIAPRMEPVAVQRARGESAAVPKRSAKLPARPVPRIVTRAGWGANERIVKEAPSYTGPIQVVFVHHTATGNGYTCGQSASIVRGIEAYQVKSKGWNDIGYNFLVDKCGNVFEGRKGGVHRSVLGAHTLGFNDNASAIAVIGDFRSVRIPVAARASVAQVAAYKLGAWGSPPAGRVAYVSGGSNKYPAGRTATLSRISGHRDAGSTECPGNALYLQLPAIRAIAGGAPIGLRYQKLSGAGAYAGKFYTRGLLQPLWTLSTPTRMMDRFEVWLDGRLFTAAPAGHRLARLQLPAGEHTVAVKAVHLSGRTSITSARILADPVPPEFTAAPQVALRTGSMQSSIPVRVSWQAADGNGLRSVRVTGTGRAVLGATARAFDTTTTLGEPGAWTVTAADRAGNVRHASVTRTPALVPEAEAQRTGSWRTLRNPGFVGSEAAAASARGASLTWTVTGRSAALVATRTATSGRVRIVLDGRDQGVVDLASASTKYRQAVWTRMWPDSGTHTIRVQVESGSAVLDGLTHLR